jgi:hypothetical protein
MHHHFKRTRIEAILPAADALSDLQTYDSAEIAVRSSKSLVSTQQHWKTNLARLTNYLLCLVIWFNS